MSSLVNSQVLCYDENGNIGSLTEIFPNGQFELKNHYLTWVSDTCRILKDKWIPNADGILRSIPDGVYIDVEYTGNNVGNLFRAQSGVYDGAVVLPEPLGQVTLGLINIRAIRVIDEMEDWEY